MIGSDAIGLLFRLQAKNEASPAIKEVQKDTEEAAKKIESSVKSASDSVANSSSKATKTAKSEVEALRDSVNKETKNIQSSGEDAFNSLAKNIGLTTEQTAQLGATLPIVGTILVTMTAAAIGAGIALFNVAKQASDYGSEIKDASDKTGLSAETLSTLRLAANQSGSSLEAISGSVTKFSKLIGSAAEGSKQAAASLVRLGLDPKKAINDLDGSLEIVFKRISDAKNPIIATKLATEAFGKSGADLIPVIKQMDGDFQAFKKHCEELGVALSTDDVNAADEFGDQLTELKAVAQSVGLHFAKEFMPAIVNAMTAIESALSSNQAAFKRWGDEISNVIKLVERLFGFFTSSQGQFLIQTIQYAASFSQGGTGVFTPVIVPPAPTLLTGAASANDGSKKKPSGEGLGGGAGGGGGKGGGKDTKNKLIDAQIKGYQLDADIAKAAYENYKKTLDEQLKNQKISTDDFLAQFDTHINEYAEKVSAAFDKEEAALPSRFSGQELVNAQKELAKKRLDFENNLSQDIAKTDIDASNVYIKLKEDQYKRANDLAKLAADTDIKTQEESFNNLEIGQAKYIQNVSNIKTRALEAEKARAEKAAVDIFNILKLNDTTGQLTDEQIKQNSKYIEFQQKAAQIQGQITKQAADTSEELIKLAQSVTKEVNDELTKLNEDLANQGAAKVTEAAQKKIANNKEVSKSLIGLRDLELSLAEEEFHRQETAADKERARREKEVEGVANNEDLIQSIRSNAQDKALIAVEAYEAKKREIEQKYSDNQIGFAKVKESGIGGGLLGGIVDSLGGIDKLTKPLDTLNQIGQILGSTFSQVGQAVGQALDSFIKFGSVGGSFRKFAAELISTIAQMAAVQAIYELAQGFAMLALAFFGYTPAGPSATAHFIAAAEFGLIAGVATLAGRGIAGNAFQQQTSSGASSSGVASAGSSGSTSSSSSSDERTITEGRNDGKRQPDNIDVLHIKAPKGWFDDELRDTINKRRAGHAYLVKLIEDVT